ncbi:MAG TPA: methyltransferase dimerization domain-containing protein, partial [Acidimicrobiales bacterium]|nr:methyltransferase dimerization domain-containing protein [Acidimicrobiales bacterium]
MTRGTYPSTGDPEMAKQLHQLVTGYRVSQVVSAIARFGIADRLADGPVGLDQLAVRLDIVHDHLYRLLRGAVSIGLIEEVELRTFALTPLGELLRSDVAGSLRSYAMALTAPGHWLPWGRLPHAVVSRQPQTKASLGSDIVEYHR